MEQLPLVPGASGAAVSDLQHRLAALGLPVDGDEPGTYGPATEAAVRRFQERRGLRVDGQCGAQTWTGLVEAGWRLGDRYLYLTEPMLRGDDVAELQRRLSDLGFHGARVDGFFGAGTAAAVQDFQRNAGLVVDGICGPATLQALARLGSRGDGREPVARVLERESLRRAPRTLADRRVVVTEPGGVDALAGALARTLTRAGATATVVSHPDGSEQAAQANASGADVVVGLDLRGTGEGCRTAFFAGFSGESVGGRHLAELIQGRLPEVLGVADAGACGMSLPLLRETRMPAVICELGPAPQVVERSAEVVDALRNVLEAWASASWD